MTRAKEVPAGANGGQPQHVSDGDFNGPSSIPHDSDALLRARRHDYAVLVVSQRADGVVISQVFTTLHPAERKLARCRERGLPASMTLVRLVPASLAIDAADAIGGESL